MNFIKTPLTYKDDSPIINRNIEERMAMIDNLIELIVFTPCGSFAADSDFGFEYWNHEFSNIHFKDFNNGQNGSFMNGIYNEVTRKECQDSIKQSLNTYEPQLKQVDVSIELLSVAPEKNQGKKVNSKYEVVVLVTGMLDDGLGTYTQYRKDISFLMEPTCRKVKI